MSSDLTYEQYVWDDVDRQRLAELVRDPVFVKAANIAVRRDQLPPNVALAMTPDQLATKAAISAGMTHLLQRLVSLSNPASDEQPLAGWGVDPT